MINIIIQPPSSNGNGMGIKLKNAKLPDTAAIICKNHPAPFWVACPTSLTKPTGPMKSAFSLPVSTRTVATFRYQTCRPAVFMLSTNPRRLREISRWTPISPYGSVCPNACRGIISILRFWPFLLIVSVSFFSGFWRMIAVMASQFSMG